MNEEQMRLRIEELEVINNRLRIGTKHLCDTLDSLDALLGNDDVFFLLCKELTLKLAIADDKNQQLVALYNRDKFQH